MASHSHRSTATTLVNDREDVLGTDIELKDAHGRTMRETEDFEKKAPTIRDFCNRLKVMVAWVKEQYPDYYQIGVIQLTEEQKNDKRRYHTQEEDFIYDKLSVKMIKAFMSSNKTKPNSQKQYSFVHMRKYHNSIQYGASRSGKALPVSYVTGMTKFLESFKKESNEAKKHGRLEEREADPITYSFYKLICDMAIKIGDMYLWAYTVCQWNCIARSINIDGLSFGQFSLGMDSVVIEFYDTKSDQTGEKTVPKNCFANPFDMEVCIFTALGCFLSVQEEVWSTDRDTLFRAKNTKVGSAAHTYNTKLHHLFKTHLKDTVPDFVRPDHANSHGIRKGGGTFATSGTTCPPPISSVAGRGEWSMGKIFDIYWMFAHAGDQYLGRLLAGLDPNTSKFACFPPHFIAGIENNYIREAIELCFNNILQRCRAEFPNIQGFILRCLASMVHHEDKFRLIIEKNPRNPIAQIPIFSNHHLLQRLKALVSTKASNKIPKVTGIPPHVSMIVTMQDLIEKFMKESEERKKQFDEMGRIVSEKLEEIAADNGNVTRASVEEIFATQFSSFKDTIENGIKESVRETMAESGLVIPQNRIQIQRKENRNDITSNINDSFTLFNYNGRFYHVPEDFNFPEKVKRNRGWMFWLLGMDFKGSASI